MVDAWWLKFAFRYKLLMEIWYYQLMNTRKLVINGFFLSIEVSTEAIIIEQLQQDCCYFNQRQHKYKTGKVMIEMRDLYTTCFI